MAENTVVYQGTGRRKNAVARVRLVPGTGKVTINKRDAEQYFGRHQLVENALAPFKVTDTAGQFDVIALCDGGGISGQSGALRLGIARALLNAGDYRADLKKAGFLTRDARVVERKKYGLKKARRAPQFSKRLASAWRERERICVRKPRRMISITIKRRLARIGTDSFPRLR